MTQKQIIALGFFDGVHLGHQTLLRACRKLAEQMGVGTAAITFEKHPQSMFTDDPPALLNTNAERIGLLRQYGMETVISYPVNKTVMETPWEQFLEELRREHGAVGFVCGYDFRFGNKGEGNVQKLRAFCGQNNLPCIVMPEQTLDGVRVSSTYIREQILDGDMATAVRFLGHPHVLTGEVVSGRHLGRKLGIPTANLTVPPGVTVPKFGVYACRVRVDGRDYPAVANVGTRPTVGGHRVTVEPWILDFEGDLYGQTITLEFYRFLRPEQKFDSLEELQAEIQKNAAQTREFFEKI